MPFPLLSLRFNESQSIFLFYRRNKNLQFIAQPLLSRNWQRLLLYVVQENQTYTPKAYKVIGMSWTLLKMSLELSLWTQVKYFHQQKLWMVHKVTAHQSLSRCEIPHWTKLKLPPRYLSPSAPRCLKKRTSISAAIRISLYYFKAERAASVKHHLSLVPGCKKAIPRTDWKESNRRCPGPRTLQRRKL